ncbi:MAG: hypothetical protein ACFE96_19015 [Candidatus Hermodarchaeota archaeon]
MAFITASASIIWGIILFPYGIPLIFVGAVILTAQTLGANNRSKLRRIVLHELQMNPDASLKEIQKSTGITKGDVKAIMIDLKAEELFTDTFSKETGRVKHGSVQKEAIGHREINKYCHNCGTAISSELDQYCAYCGSKI